MEFYSAVCQRWYNGNPTDYRNDQIIIIASSYYEAQEKLNKCLAQLNKNSDKEDSYTYKIIKDLHECYGIMIADGFDDSTYHYGISKYNTLDNTI